MPHRAAALRARSTPRWLAALVGLFASLTPALGQTQEGDPCTGLVSSRRLPIIPAALGPGEVGLTFVGHATFLIESPGGVKIATDYNDYVRPRATPDVVTMNHAHSTHFTTHPDPAIAHVLRGWDPSGGPARHNLAVGDVIIRNVPTNIRDWGGGTERDGNSIFVFETAGLCVAHLGHLHHTLLPGHLKMLGRIDVLLVPVDGGYTLDTDGMLEVIGQINAPLMIPMHYFGPSTLNRFISRVREKYPVEFSRSSSITASRESLPTSPKMLVLPEQ
ncbi:MBL fold metallo-hydrolase [Alsobacter sp. SYSU M60028]|uniref:MBL fold metallo-hydrolase n=1 Tax=Alsobacter ponti TaxID=2962936 RepID=A0ABT1L854_9HYPH|nr:MBL fold metallo-hydrolase [Alsobacter ponti]MCP8937241.1 MBL fold metallo-hydrolase [Alsobacter ponti]